MMLPRGLHGAKEAQLGRGLPHTLSLAYLLTNPRTRRRVSYGCTKQDGQPEPLSRTHVWYVVLLFLWT